VRGVAGFCDRCCLGKRIAGRWRREWRPGAGEKKNEGVAERGAVWGKIGSLVLFLAKGREVWLAAESEGGAVVGSEEGR